MKGNVVSVPTSEWAEGTVRVGKGPQAATGDVPWWVSGDVLSAIDAMTPISELARGRASKVLIEAQERGPRILVRNNTVVGVIMGIDDFKAFARGWQQEPGGALRPVAAQASDEEPMLG